MSFDYWKIGFDGNWLTSGNWTSGTPTSSSTVVIGAPGSYTISVNTNALATSVELDAAGATLNQTAGAFDVTGALTIEAGTAILRSANTFDDGVQQGGGKLEVANDAALGTDTYIFGAGMLRAIRDVTLTNQMSMSGSLNFSAAHGYTLTENASQLSYDGSSGGSVVFGSAGNDGTIVWHSNGPSFTGDADYSTEIAAGTVKAGDSNWYLIFGLSSKTQIDSGGTLDINGFGGGLNVLQGGGSIVNSGAAATLAINSGGNFSGLISGDTGLEISPAATLMLTGNNTYTGGTTIDTTATLQLGSGKAAGSIKGNIVDNGTLIYDHSGSLTITNNISGVGGGVVFEGGGIFTVNSDQNYTGDTAATGVTLKGATDAAFGTGELDFNGSEYVGTADISVSNEMEFRNGCTVAAAHGMTIFGGPSWLLVGSTLTVGDSTNDGAVYWRSGAGSAVVNGSACVLDVRSDFVAADNGFSLLTGQVGKVTVEAGARLDMNQWGGTIANLTGAGTVVANSGATIILNGGNFGGIITGPASVEIENTGFVLSGASNYADGTAIDAGASLSLGNGGTTGSIVGDITDNGTLIINHSNTFTESAAIAGTGGFTQMGSGTTIINRLESYSGETDILRGILSIDRATAIGSGTLRLEGGELLATTNVTLINALAIDGGGTSIIAAATGKTLTTANTPYLVDATIPNETLQFGDGTNNGTIVWNGAAGSTIINASHFAVDVASGTLKAGNSSFGVLTGNISITKIEAGATLDIAGYGMLANGLTGSGHLANSGPDNFFDMNGGNFSGSIDSTIDLQTAQTATLKNVSYSGTVEVTAGTLTLIGTAPPAVKLDAGTTLKLNNVAGVNGVVSVTASVSDTIAGGSGNDTFRLGHTLLNGDAINGGAGTDTVVLAGDYSGGLTFAATTMLNVEDLRLANGFSYNLTTNDATVAGTKTLIVDASALTATHSLTFNGSAETNGHFQITGGLGADVLTGGARSDTFVYTSAAQSSSVHHDTINAFDFGSDKFDITGTISAIDAKVNRTVSTASFDTDISAAASAGHLLAHTAMLVTANAGTLSGHTFLVVDLNGTAGYQAGADLVIDMHGATGTLATTDFI